MCASKANGLTEQQLRELVTDPLWYQTLPRYWRPSLWQKTIGRALGKRGPAIPRWMDNAFEQLLQEDAVNLASEGPDWDAERRSIDTIVIHHTSRRAGLAVSHLDAMHLLRLYVTYYNSPTEEERPLVQDKPIYSGHFRNGRQVFRAYHWLIRANGDADRLLHDHETGWQAGNWSINCRSVAICVDDDLTRRRPSPTVLGAIVDVIQTHYADVSLSRDTLLGHREVNPRSICPGRKFLPIWKEQLLRALDAQGERA